jgi:hypothetical protein
MTTSTIPVSLYAATKKANELMAHTYSHLFKLPTTGLRFFTVYGPWGRPDMALFLFAKAILEDRPIDVFNHGKMRRDFTYIDDIAEGVIRVLDRPPQADPAFDKQVPDPATSWAPYRVFNIGNHQPVELMAFIEALEQALGKTARKNFLPMQDGDVPATYADTTELKFATGFSPGPPWSRACAALSIGTGAIMADARIIPVVLSGGSGTRLWPVSREKHPKQLQPLLGDASLLQDTLQRLEGLPLGAPIVVSNQEYRFITAEQLRLLGLANWTLLLEPVGRNTAPALTAAALHAVREWRRPGAAGDAGGPPRARMPAPSAPRCCAACPRRRPAPW